MILVSSLFKALISIDFSIISHLIHYNIIKNLTRSLKWTRHENYSDSENIYVLYHEASTATVVNSYETCTSGINCNCYVNVRLNNNSNRKKYAFIDFCKKKLEKNENGDYDLFKVWDEKDIKPLDCSSTSFSQTSSDPDFKCVKEADTDIYEVRYWESILINDYKSY